MSQGRKPRELPDGVSAAELAERVHGSPARIEHLLEELEDLQYLELENRDAVL